MTTSKRLAWTPKKGRSREEWRIFSDTLYDMERGLIACVERELNARDVRVEARRLSVTARKLLIDGGLLNLVDNPTFHVLKKMPRDITKFIFEIDEETGGRKEIGGIEIGSLPGYKLEIHSREQRYSLYSAIFDTGQRASLKVRKWMKQGLVEGEIDGVVMRSTIEQIVKYIANTEGAHSEVSVRKTADGETQGQPRRKKGSQEGRWLEMLGGTAHEGDSKFEMGRGPIEKEGEEDPLTYPQWAVLCVTVYVYNEIKNHFRENENAWSVEMGPYYPGAAGYFKIKGQQKLHISGPFVSPGPDKQPRHLKMQAARELYIESENRLQDANVIPSNATQV